MKYDHLNDPEFHECMSIMAEQSGQDTNDFKDKIYSEGLCDISIDQIKQAVWSLIRTRTYASFPKIAEIRDIVGGKVEDNAEVQATAVIQAIRRYGSARSVVFDDPVTMAVIHQGFGGWQKICSELMEDEFQYFIKDFSRHYIAFKRTNVHHYGVLPGYADPVGKGPALIGDAKKAELVLAMGGTEITKKTPVISMIGYLADRMVA